MSDAAGRDVAVIVAAGGEGARMARATGGARKQFVLLGDAPVFVSSIQTLAGIDAVGPVVVVVPEPAIAPASEALNEHGLGDRVILATGGMSRQESVGNGLAAMPAGLRYVLVHDAVRPFVSAELIGRVINAVRRTGAAAPGVPVADTLRRADGAMLRDRVDRDGLFAMQTPQGARRDWLEAALGLATNATATDEVGALQAAGYPVEMVEGDEWNRKLTRPEDLELARLLWPAWQTRHSG